MTQWKYCPECGADLVPVVGEDGRKRPGCPDGHFIRYNNPVPTAMAFIRNQNGHYLMLKRAINPNKGKWDIPGGFLEDRDTPEEGAIREVKEETGLDIKLERMLGVYPDEYSGSGITLNFAFEAATDSDQVTLSDESSDYQWLPLDELHQPAFECERQALAALKKLQ